MFSNEQSEILEAISVLGVDFVSRNSAYRTTLEIFVETGELLPVDVKRADDVHTMNVRMLESYLRTGEESLRFLNWRYYLTD